MGLTTDQHDGCLHETDPETGMRKCYLILPDGERKNLVRPVRRQYMHLICGSVTWMIQSLAETFAAQPSFYTRTMCIQCKGHFPVSEFVWNGTDEKVGT